MGAVLATRPIDVPPYPTSDEPMMSIPQWSHPPSIDQYCESVCENMMNYDRQAYFSCLYGCRAGFDAARDAKGMSSCSRDTHDEEEEDEMRERERFEAYPFPPIPSDEQEVLSHRSTHLTSINHMCFGGRRDLCGDSTNAFRVLVAGGGTGISTLQLASQFYRYCGDNGWEIVHLDYARSSRTSAKKLLRSYDMLRPNIRFVLGSIDDAPDLLITDEHDGFDYIDCVGVLHHLPDPSRGMRRLIEVLAPDGCVQGMVYGKVGRHGVHAVQRVLRTLAPPSATTWDERVRIAKKILMSLPKSNWLRVDDVRWDAIVRGEREDSGGGYSIVDNDAALVDLVMPVIERPFTVRDVDRMVRETGLMSHPTFWPHAMYDPSVHLQDLVDSDDSLDRSIVRTIERLADIERFELAELVASNIAQHWFFARSQRTRHDFPQATPSDLDLIPVLVSSSHDRPFLDGATLAASIRQRRNRMHYRYQNMKYEFELSDLSLVLLSRIDGTRSIRRILESVVRERGQHSVVEVSESWAMLYQRMHGIHQLFLSTRGVGALGPL